MLAKFRKAKQPEIARLAAAQAKGLLPEIYAGPRPDFGAALRNAAGIAIIAEYKRASPSRGAIRLDLAAGDVALGYERGGAAAMSVLTESHWFGGDIAFLEQCRQACGLPLLRKDFIFDPLQVAATGATPASALLLIARMLPDAATLAALRRQTEELGMAAVVEVFDAADLALARASGAGIIQVNARDLATLAVDRNACLDLIGAAGDRTGELWIAASGMQNAADLAQAEAAGYDAALIGGALMDKPDPGQALAELRRRP
ncbi:MAG: indole-3-glycerol-phosphate synthase [Desulfovibrio sp.]|nr:indole-3-glycerol-phosphate synthase [Desulfovibrio sp.]